MNKYREVRQIGSGAFSQVIQAIHGPTGDFVAIKKVFRGLNNPNNSSSSAAAAASALAAAQAEADVLTQLRHPNIIHLRETFKDGPQLCIVLEYMDLNLHELITQRDSSLFEESAVQGILRQVLEGICFIHSAGYIHRDLKPENLLVHGNVVKIADMGLVRPVHSKRPLTAYVSTRWYRAPELMLQIDIYGCPVDIWAIGTIAAELLSLQPLFPGSSQIDQLQRIFRVLGSPTLTRGNGDAWYVGAVQARKLGVSFNVEKTVPLSDLLPRTVSERMVQFIGSMLRLNPGSRVSAKQALE
ncbi:kinase-like protein, partial [Ramicandelaber brevisporus]